MKPWLWAEVTAIRNVLINFIKNGEVMKFVQKFGWSLKSSRIKKPCLHHHGLTWVGSRIWGRLSRIGERGSAVQVINRYSGE